MNNCTQCTSYLIVHVDIGDDMVVTCVDIERIFPSLISFLPLPVQAILHAHPYHIDSLLQMSEVSKMGEDIQTATELIGR